MKAITDPAALAFAASPTMLRISRLGVIALAALAGDGLVSAMNRRDLAPETIAAYQEIVANLRRAAQEQIDAIEAHGSGAFDGSGEVPEA